MRYRIFTRNRVFIRGSYRHRKRHKNLSDKKAERTRIFLIRGVKNFNPLLIRFRISDYQIEYFRSCVRINWYSGFFPRVHAISRTTTRIIRTGIVINAIDIHAFISCRPATLSHLSGRRFCPDTRVSRALRAQSQSTV